MTKASIPVPVVSLLLLVAACAAKPAPPPRYVRAEVVKEEPAEQRADVIDLSEALQRSLDDARRGKRRRSTRRKARNSA